jgi:uncharacterized membrane protein
MEYPPIIGLGNWLISFITPDQFSDRWFFDINASIAIILFLLSALLIKKMKPEYAYLYPLAPAVVASLFINWDLWVVVGAILAIYFFDQKKYEASSIWLGIAISTKFFPIVFLIPTAIIFYQHKQIAEFIKFIARTFLIWAAFNLPLAAIYFEGWWRFFKLNLERSSDFGSIWYALDLLGINLPSVNLLSIIFTLLLFTYLISYLLKLPTPPTLAEVAFFTVVIFTTTAKVYSPQYVLWLTPLAVLALTNKKQQIKFWIWQAAEMIYHLAIWQYLAAYTGANFGLPAGGYAIACLLRVAGIWIFTHEVMSQLAKKSTVNQA